MSDFEPIRIIRIIEESITKPRNDGKAGSNLYDVPFRLSHNPSKEWIDFFTQAWDTPANPSLAHRPGICRISGETIWLAGTTVEEVERFHKDSQSGYSLANGAQFTPDGRDIDFGHAGAIVFTLTDVVGFNLVR